MQNSFLNTADINCWIVNLIPFEKRNKTLEFQERCIQDKVFGMGWAVPCLDFEAPISESNIEKYIKTYNESGLQFAINQHSEETLSDFIKAYNEEAAADYNKIKKGDYVITRLKSDRYYMGRVASDCALYLYKEEDSLYSRISWGAYVEAWIEIAYENEIPPEIVSRLLRRSHSTIKRINQDRLKLLVIAMYEDRTQ